MLVVVGSVHASPGATTTACGVATAWRAVDPGRTVVLIEADPDGGVLAARFSELRADRTLVDLAAGARRSVDREGVLAGAQHLGDGLPVVVAPPAAEQAAAALRAIADPLARALVATDDLAVVDVGRLGAERPAVPLVRHADLALLVCAPTLEQAAVLQPRLTELRRLGARMGLVCVGRGTHTSDEVARAGDVPLLATLPWDPRAAAAFDGGVVGARRLRHSTLWRALTALATTLAEELAMRRRPDVVAGPVGEMP